MKLDIDSPVPLHVQLKDILRNEILEGDLKGKIPSERELMERFEVSRSTVRQAVSGLVREGVLKKIHGKGTFISSRPVEEWLGNICTYNEVIEQMGMRPSTRLLRQGRETAPQEIADTLGVTEFYAIERLRYANEVPIAIEKQYYPLELGLSLAEFDLNVAVLYDLLEFNLGKRLWEAEQVISCRIPTKEEMLNLNISDKTPVLVAERVIYDPEGHPVEFLRSSFRADKYAFRINLARRRV